MEREFELEEMAHWGGVQWHNMGGQTHETCEVSHR